MKNALPMLLALCAITACSTGNKKPMETPKDKLVHQLFTYAQEGKIAYGHQDDLSYGHAWKVEDWENDKLERSDVKAVTGKYPMVVGFDLGDIEHGAEKNLDKVPFGLMRKAVAKHVERGGIVTFSWHPDNPLTGGDAWDISSDQVVKSVLPGGENERLFRSWLERAADFVESLGDVAVIFRPWHENLGSWFWWGKKLCTAQEYIDLYRLTWTYFTKERGLTNIIWCYSPNGDCTPEEYMSRYPGDEFVDMIGFDTYGHDGEEAKVRFMENVKRNLTFLTAIAYEHEKLLCFAETGLEGLRDPSWWTETLIPAVKGYPVSYLLTWRNACDIPTHFYAPWEGFENTEDFIEFSKLDNIVFLD